MEHKLFRSKFQLWDYMRHKCKGIDLNTTLRLPMFWFAMEDGGQFKNGSAKEYAVCVNDKFGLDVNTKLSYRSGKSCVLFFGEEDKVEPIVEEVVVQEDEAPATEGVVEEVVVETVAAQEEASEEVEEDKSEADEDNTNSVFIDWEWINSLKSTQKDKKAFDGYAQRNFSLDLNQGKKISVMVEEFKSKMGVED